MKVNKFIATVDLDASVSVAYFTFAKFGFILGYESFNH